MVPEFHKKVSGLMPKCNQFHLMPHGIADIDNHFLKMSYCYKICGEFERNAEYIDIKDNFSDNIVKRLLLFVENNYRSKCLLSEAAENIGYDYAYVSKKFKYSTGISFKEYVNIVRVSNSKLLLASSRMSITEIAAESGFNCHRTFNREFKKIVGVTPINYKNVMSHEK